MIDSTVWKNFAISDLFRIENCKCNDAGSLADGDDIFYIGAKKENHGIMKRVAYDKKLMTKGNCMVFICDGQGSVGYSNYMDNDFIGSTTLSVGYNDRLNKYIGLFLTTILDLERPKYSYGRKYRKFLPTTTIKIPADKSGTPDWNYMESYIKKIYDTAVPKITTKIKRKDMPINTGSWKEIKLSELFGVERGVRLTKENRIFGKLPFATAGESNEGISGYIANNDMKVYKDVLTIDMFCNCFYRGYEFSCDDNILVLNDKHKTNKYVKLFLASVINADKYRYAYGRQYRQKDFMNHTIKLPVDPVGNPDWQYMENYIKSLPYSDLL